LKYIILIIYFLLMIYLGIRSSGKIKSNSDYYIAGKKGNIWQITGSLLATILGSSAILGTVDLALTQGWAASWFLISAAIGLFILISLSRLVRQQGKYTLPQMIGDFYGGEAKLISSLIISTAWIGVIAAQIIGAAKILQGFTGLSYSAGVWISGLVFIFYTLIGGQISVLKTDLYQSFIIIGGILITAMFILFTETTPVARMTGLNFPFNSGFKPFDLVVLFFIHSTTYIVGPDIYSRIFCAESRATARRSVLLTAVILVPFSLCITFIGVFASFRFPGLNQQHGSALVPVMLQILPEWAIGLLIAALLSAVMSSGATTLLTSALIVSDPISRGLDTEKSLRNTKLIMLVIGLLSIFFSLKTTSIIEAMLIALTFFSGAFIVPTLAGLFSFRTSRWQSTTAIITGGCTALAGKIYSLYGGKVIGNVIIISAFVINALILFYPRRTLQIEDQRR
jgi:solute:Na+ symporter, SSS family